MADRARRCLSATGSAPAIPVRFRWGVSTLSGRAWSCDDALGRALLDAVKGETPGWPEVDDLAIARYAAAMLDGEILGAPRRRGEVQPPSVAASGAVAGRRPR